MHMPGHIYSKVGMWHEAATAMDSATRTELRYMNDRLALPFETWNCPHNRNYLCYIQEQLGMAEASLQGSADMLASPKYGKAARFFLEDLYGPHDFSQRDGEFARVVPALVRLFPQEILATVEALAALHSLSERLDGAMAGVLTAMPLTAAGYGEAWRRVGFAEERERQIGLMLAVGQALDRYTRKPLLRHSLRLMRGPAQAAGLSTLQRFLERGFETFADMRGAAPFLSAIAEREAALAVRLFEAGGAA